LPELRRFRADLHVHTALSACAGLAMTPPAILAAAHSRGIDVVGVVDHNAAGNAHAAAAAQQQGAQNSAHVLPGLEIQSAEGVHVLCLCDGPEAAEAMQDYVCDRLPEIPPEPEVTDRQSLLGADGRQVGHETRPLWLPTEIDLREICREGQRRGLLMIAAHVIRPVTGLIPLMGGVPEDLAIDAIESGLKWPLQPRAAAELAGYPRVTASDAHALEEIGATHTDFWVAEPSVAELKLALQGASGRRATPGPDGLSGPADGSA
jgi:PHP family Zn ribbon phosphoesterase